MTTVNYPVAFDWYAPSASVTLINLAGDRFPLWMTSDELEKNASKIGLHSKHLAVFREVTVDWQGAFYQITISLCPEYEDAVAIMNSKLIVQGDTQVEVKMGHATGAPGMESTFQVFTGRVINIQFSIGQEISLTLKAVPAPSIVAQGSGGSAQSLSEPRVAVIRKMWELTKGASVDDVLVTDGDSRRLLDEKITIEQAGKAPAAIIQQLIEEAMCVQFISGNKLILVARNTALKGKPSCAFEVYNRTGQLGGGPDKKFMFPILACSSSSTHLFTRGMFDLASKNVDPAQKQVLDDQLKVIENKYTEKMEALVPKASPAKKVGGGPKKKKLTEKELETARSELTSQMESELETTRRDAEIRWQRQRMNSGIDLKVDTLFIPTIIPFSVAAVSGLGKYIDGNFLITKVTHRVGMDGGATTWEGKHNGTVGDEDAEETAATMSSSPVVDDDGKVEIKPSSPSVDLIQILRSRS